MSQQLSAAEVKKRLVRLTNLERLYAGQKRTAARLRAENKQLRRENAELKRYFTGLVQSQAARIEQLEAMVFGRRPKGGRTASPLSSQKQRRPDSSYRRAIPPDDEVTTETYHPVSGCHRCGSQLTDIQPHVRYVEDVVLAALSDLPSRTVEKRTIERGWCTKCGHYSSAAELRGQPVSLGPQVRLLVTYLSNIQGLTYGQIQALVTDLYGLSVTDGEIAVLLNSQRQQLLPAYQALQENIREGPSHFDETRYRVQSEQGAGYVWVMASAATEDVVFRCSDSRGKSNAEALAGNDFEAVGITDRYGAYKHVFASGKHQICWAHLQRNARDLARLECLGPAARNRTTRFYQRLSAMYEQVRLCHAEPYDAAVRQSQAARLLAQTIQACRPDCRDPKELASLKAGIREYQDSLFVCLVVPGVPPDNNKAERHLRKLVLKRVRSFGVKTRKGAQVLETLMSVCWSLWYRDRAHFFQNLQQATKQQAA